MLRIPTDSFFSTPAKENVNRHKAKDRSQSQCMSRHSENVAERNEKQYENGRDHNSPHGETIQWVEMYRDRGDTVGK